MKAVSTHTPHEDLQHVNMSDAYVAGVFMSYCPSQPDFGRHLCLHRFKLWWLRPSHGNAGLDVPLETTLLVAECSSAPAGALEFAVLLPISDTYARATLHRAGGAGGTDSAEDPAALALSADTGDDGVLLPKILEILLVATGQDPFRLARRVVGEATKRLKDQLGLARVSEGYAQPVKAAGFADTFGWCTWDSFYTMVTPEGALLPCVWRYENDTDN